MTASSLAGKQAAKQAAKVLGGLYETFVGTDASQIEINPLAVSEDGRLLVLDAKVGFDGNAMFRHKDLAALLPQPAHKGEALTIVGHSVVVAAEEDDNVSKLWCEESNLCGLHVSVINQGALARLGCREG